MKKSNTIILFNQKEVRRYWNDEKELWYFSIIDIISILTDSSIPKRYWSDLKAKLKKEGSELYENIVQLKFKASDGKNYATDCFSTEDLLRVIQSVPSPKAEPFKLWLAEASTTEISKKQKPTGLQENKNVARKGSNAAKQTKLEIEKQTGESIITSKNSKTLQKKRNR